MWHTFPVRATGHTAGAIAIATVLWAAAAHSEVDPCARALDTARQLRNAGAIRQALRALGDCSACASASEVCDATRVSLRSAMPSIVVAARDPEGRDLSGAKIFIDDAPVPPDRAVEVDPGRHRARVELAGRVVTQRVAELAENDHLDLKVILESAPVPARTITARPVPWSVWALGASALAAFATSGVLWGVASHDQADANAALGATQYTLSYRFELANAKLSDEHALLLAGDVAFAIGAAALLTSAVLYLVRPTRTVTLGAASFALTF